MTPKSFRTAQVFSAAPPVLHVASLNTPGQAHRSGVYAPMLPHILSVRRIGSSMMSSPPSLLLLLLLVPAAVDSEWRQGKPGRHWRTDQELGRRRDLTLHPWRSSRRGGGPGSSLWRRGPTDWQTLTETESEKVRRYNSRYRDRRHFEAHWSPDVPSFEQSWRGQHDVQDDGDPDSESMDTSTTSDYLTEYNTRVTPSPNTTGEMTDMSENQMKNETKSEEEDDKKEGSDDEDEDEEKDKEKKKTKEAKECKKAKSGRCLTRAERELLLPNGFQLNLEPKFGFNIYNNDEMGSE